VAKAEAAPVGSAQSAGDIQIPYNPGLEVTADNVEEVLSRPLEGEAAGSGGLLVWRGSRLYRKNPDGTLSLMDSSLDVQTDDLGQKWLDYDEAGNAIIQVSLKVWATINFAYDSAEINADSVKVLEAFGRALNTPALRSSSLLIAGHTDSNGAPPYNIRLSRERANAVSKWLHDNMGVDQDRLICTGYGQDHPIAPNDTPEGQAKNRRVEFVLLPEMNTES
jgi:outer membrane protein OmpA-like peptidoglycan-associated protein